MTEKMCRNNRRECPGHNTSLSNLNISDWVQNCHFLSQEIQYLTPWLCGRKELPENKSINSPRKDCFLNSYNDPQPTKITTDRRNCWHFDITQSQFEQTAVYHCIWDGLWSLEIYFQFIHIFLLLCFLGIFDQRPHNEWPRGCPPSATAAKRHKMASAEMCFLRRAQNSAIRQTCIWKALVSGSWTAESHSGLIYCALACSSNVLFFTESFSQKISIEKTWSSFWHCFPGEIPSHSFWKTV